MTDRCRSCKAEIRWALSVGGYLMPLDYAPTADGNIRLERVDDPERTPRARVVLPADRVDGEQLYLAHFATCAQADRWRRR